MNVLSLFDGMSCGQLALQRAGIEVEKYYASEIDEHAIKVTQHNFPKTVQLGTVEQWQLWDLENGLDWSGIDLIIAGSPCQGFSFAGKQLAFDDPRSKLFFTFVDILEHTRKHNPNVKFFLENVKMKKEFENVITNILGVEPVFINSALVSAQNRPRIYWANWAFPQPQNKNITFKSIFSEDYSHKVSEKESIRIRNSKRNRIITNKTEKCPTILATQNTKYGTDCVLIEIGETQLIRLDILTAERAQTLPEGYTIPAKSRARRMHCIGNGWTVDVIAHIFNFMDDLL